MSERRGPWFLLTGLALGVALGIAYGWLVGPVKYVDTAPEALVQSDKDQYRALIAQAYQSNGNLERARQRLALLKDASLAEALAGQAQRMVASGSTEADARAVAQLAAVLGPTPQPSSTPAATLPGMFTATPRVGGTNLPTATLDLGAAVRSATPVPSATPTASPTVTQTPLATFTPRPTLRPSATLGPPFVLKERQRTCDISIPPGMLQVEVTDRAGTPVAGVRVVVTWASGESIFYTGLMPEFNAGYADFTMAAGVTYSLRAGEGGELVSGLAINECALADKSAYQGGWKLKFTQ